MTAASDWLTAKATFDTARTAVETARATFATAQTALEDTVSALGAFVDSDEPLQVFETSTDNFVVVLLINSTVIIRSVDMS